MRARAAAKLKVDIRAGLTKPDRPFGSPEFDKPELHFQHFDDCLEIPQVQTIGDVVDFDILPGSDDVYNFRKGQWEKLASGPNQAPNMAYLGWGIYVMKKVDSDPKRQKAAWSAAAHLGGKDLSMWTAAYPSGFQPYRKSHTNLDLWALAGYDKKYIGSYMKSQSDSYNHPNSAIEPRIPGIFQYYSIAEDELQKTFAGKQTAQQGADNVAAAWDKLTDKLGRENQVKYYRISMGLT